MPLFKSWLTIWEISQSSKFGERYENPNPLSLFKNVDVIKIVSDADILCEDSILYPFLGFETLGDNEQWLYNWLGWFDLSIKKKLENVHNKDQNNNESTLWYNESIISSVFWQ